MLATRGASERCCGVGATACSGSRPVAAGAPLEPAPVSTRRPRALRASGMESLRAFPGVCNMLRLAFLERLLTKSDSFARRMAVAPLFSRRLLKNLLVEVPARASHGRL